MIGIIMHPDSLHYFTHIQKYNYITYIQKLQVALAQWISFLSRKLSIPSQDSVWMGNQIGRMNFTMR